MPSTKKNKYHVISFRLNDDEYANLLLKISDANGEQKLSPSTFARASLVSAQVRVIDTKFERYRVYIAGQISHQIQVIAGALNDAFIYGNVNDELLISLSEKVDAITDEMIQLLVSIKEN